MTSRSAWPVVALVLLWAAHLVHDEAWLAADTEPLFNDEANHFRHSVEAAFYVEHADRLLFKRKSAACAPANRLETGRPFSSQALQAPIAGPIALVRQIYLSGSYPPLAYLVAAAPLALAGPDADVAVLAVDAFFLALLFAGLYSLGREFGGPWTGVLAAAIAGFYPWLGGLARMLLLDLPAAGATALAIAALLAGRGFADRRGSLAFGLAAGLAMLTKHAAAFYLAGPFLLSLRGLTKDPARRRNLAAAFLVGFAVAACYYVPRVPAEVKHFAKIRGGGEVEGDLSAREGANWAFYAVALVEQMGPAGAAAFVLALPFLLARWRGRVGWAGLWFAVPWLFFSLFSNKDLRYTVPYLPAFAFATAAGLASIPWPRIRGVAIAAVLAVLALAYVHGSWPVLDRWMAPRYVIALDARVSLGFHVPIDPEFRPRREDWKTEEIGALLEADGPPIGETRVWVLAKAEQVTDALKGREAYRWEEWRHGLAPGGFEFEWEEPGDPDLVIVPSRFLGNPGTLDRYEENLSLWAEMKGRYRPVGSVDLPGGLSASVHRRIR